MKTFRKFLALSTAIIALSIVNVSAQSYYVSSHKAVKTIEQQIDKKLRSLPYYSVFDHITYEVQGSTVILSGKVISLGTRGDAQAAVKRISGVEQVVNNIQNLSPSSFDDSIRRQALRSFGNSGLGQYLSEINPDVRIIVENGRVTLEGYVFSSSDRDRFNIFANALTGVFSVQNNLIVGKPAKV